MNKDLNLDNYNIFFITDPKCRVIMNQNIEDKVINHLFSKYFLVNVFENTFTNSMCATRIGKGTKYSILLLKKYINEMKNKYDNFYVLKIDIKKYFYNIDHEVLKKMIRRKIKDKDAIEVLDKVIDSTNSSYINKQINRLKEKRISYLKQRNYHNNAIKEVEEIPTYQYGKGCAIGNQTSQIFGLIYLNGINHYIKEKLHLKYTINYMDDFIILHPSREYLRLCLDKIRNQLLCEYKLELNNKKTTISNMKNGIDFLGYHFILKENQLILRLKNRTKSKFKKKVKNLDKLLENNYINKLEFRQMISSYMGLLMYGNCDNLYYKYINRKLC